MASAAQGIISVIGQEGTTKVGGLKESQAAFRRHHQHLGDALLNISGIDTIDGQPVDKDEPRPPYQHRDWPRMIYHADGREVVVFGPGQLREKLKEGFREEGYPKKQVLVADAVTEKREALDREKDTQAQIRSLLDELNKLKAQQKGQGV